MPAELVMKLPAGAVVEGDAVRFETPAGSIMRVMRVGSLRELPEDRVEAVVTPLPDGAKATVVITVSVA